MKIVMYPLRIEWRNDIMNLAGAGYGPTSGVCVAHQLFRAINDNVAQAELFRRNAFSVHFAL